MSLGILQLVLLIICVHWTQAAAVQDNTYEYSCGPNCALRMKQMGIEVRFLQDNCMCIESTCQCCFQGSWPQLNITQDFCMNGEFIPEDFQLQVNATLNGNVLGMFVLSGKNPPPLCFPVPFPIPIPLAMCIRAKDIYPEDNNMHFCVDMLMKFAGFEFLTVPLNCMWIGSDGVQVVGQNQK